MSAPDPIAVVDAALSDHFGHTPVRASVSFVGVDRIEVLRFEPIPDERAYLTLGMSRHPMTSADADILSGDGPRAELMLHVRDGADRFVDVWRQVALLAATPAVEGVVYTAGMTVDLGQPLAAGSRCTGVVVVESPIAPIATAAGDVSVYLAVPATQTELAWCRVRGNEELRKRWAEADTDLLDLARAPVDLT